MTKKSGTIHFMMTGGTVDSHFDSSADTIVIGDKSDVPEYIQKLKLHNPSEFSVVCLKDSREIRYKDREKLLETVKESKHGMIVITHGTYTMPDTAQYLKGHLPENNKTIVLTGSMIPLRGFELSDAAFNLGYAVASVQTLPPGIYICMNGKVFDPDKVDKNRTESRFEET